jgi:SOS-response transcriptional repressor LexA
MRNKWLQDRIKELGKTQAALGRLLGLSSASMTKMVSGDRRIAAREVPIVAQFLEWPESTLLRMIGETDAAGITPNIAPGEMSVVKIKVIGAVEAGVFKDALEYPPDKQFYIDALPDDRYRGVVRRALQVRGPSMNMLYPDGSCVIVVSVLDLGEGWTPRSGMRVVVQRTTNEGVEATIKELVFDDDGHPWLWPRSNHPEFQQPWRVPDYWDGNGDFDEHSDNLRITALVIGSYRQEG